MSAVKRVRLVVLQSHEATPWEPREGVPRSRSECPDTSVEYCGFYRCRHWLARIDACDRSGRKSLGKVPRDAAGLTLSLSGAAGEDDRQPTLDPHQWMNDDGTMRELPPSCALDVVKQNPHGMTNEATGAATNRHRTLVARLIKSSLKKMRDAGVDLRDLLELHDRTDGRTLVGNAEQLPNMHGTKRECLSSLSSTVDGKDAPE